MDADWSATGCKGSLLGKMVFDAASTQTRSKLVTGTSQVDEISQCHHMKTQFYEIGKNEGILYFVNFELGKVQNGNEV